MFKNKIFRQRRGFVIRNYLHIVVHTFKNKEIKSFHTWAALLFATSIFLPYYVTILAVVVLGSMVLFHWERAHAAFCDVRAKVIMGFCPAVGLISMVYRNYFGALCALFLFLLLALGFYLRSGMTRQLFHKLLDLVCIGSVLSFLVAGIQKLFFLPTHPEYRPVSTFFNANHYATIIEFVVLIALYRLSHRTGHRKFYIGIIAINLAGLYLTGSMSSLAALSCAALVFLILKGKNKLALGVVGAVLAFAVFALMFPEIFPRVDMIDHTMGQRLDIWQVALRGIQETPLFGQGPLTYMNICEQFGGLPVIHSHNLFLDTILNYGLFGSLFLFFCALSQLRVIIHRLKNNVCTSMNFLILSVLAAVLVHGVTDVTIFGIQTGPLFLLICTSMGVQAETKRTRRAAPVPSLESLHRIREKYSREGSQGIYSIKR